MNEELPKISERHRSGCYSCGELAHMLGLPYETFVYHVKKGHIPGPSHVLVKRKYYPVATALIVMDYFRGRERYERHKE